MIGCARWPLLPLGSFTCCPWDGTMYAHPPRTGREAPRAQAQRAHVSHDSTPPPRAAAFERGSPLTAPAGRRCSDLIMLCCSSRLTTRERRGVHTSVMEDAHPPCTHREEGITRAA